MEQEHLLSQELNHALTEYHNKNGQNMSYNFLFSSLQKADKILIDKRIFIFSKAKKNRHVLENKNPNGYLKDLKLLATKARNIIWEDNLGLVGRIAEKYAGSFPRVEYGDIEAEGNIGLLKAIEKFDPNNGTSFKYYAIEVIDTHIKRELPKYLRLIKLQKIFLSFIASLNLLHTVFRKNSITPQMIQN